MAGKGFDLVVHKRNKKGKVVSVNPYRLLCNGNKKLFERPPHSGNLYYADGTLAEAGPEMKKQMDAEKAKQAAKDKDFEQLKAEVANLAAKAQEKAPEKPVVDLNKVKANGAPKA